MLALVMMMSSGSSPETARKMRVLSTPDESLGRLVTCMVPPVLSGQINVIDWAPVEPSGVMERPLERR